jgi:hypothetical protein
MASVATAFAAAGKVTTELEARQNEQKMPCAPCPGSSSCWRSAVPWRSGIEVSWQMSRFATGLAGAPSIRARISGLSENNTLAMAGDNALNSNAVNAIHVVIFRRIRFMDYCMVAVRSCACSAPPAIPQCLWAAFPAISRTSTSRLTVSRFLSASSISRSSGTRSPGFICCLRPIIMT